MKLKRILGRASWLLDDRYEIHYERFSLKIVDTHTLVEVLDVDGEIEKVPQEHRYYDGEELSSKEYGLHDFPSSACDKRCGASPQ